MEENTESQEPKTDAEQASAPTGRIEFRPETVFRGNAALVVQADRAEINKGAVLALTGSEVNLSQGVSWVTIGREVELEKGGSQWILAGEAEVEQGGAGILIAREVEANDMKVGILLAANVNGSVQTMLDRDGALRFGAGLGAVLGIALLLRRLIR